MGGARIDKGAVARSFSEAAESYERFAAAQAQIAASLVRRLPAAPEPALVADLGCGTGLLTGLLLQRYPRAALVGIDLAEGMVAACRERWPEGGRARFALADAEAAEARVPGVELVASSCALQWFLDPARTLALWAGVLSRGGRMALATLGEGSFAELDAAHREALGAALPGLRFPDAPALAALVRTAGLAPLLVEAEAITLWHADAREALRSFHETGAVLPRDAPLSLSQMRRLIAAYERRRDARGLVPMTYRSIHVIAERRS
jgi:malonyl-CoA O-methyltransferase